MTQAARTGFRKGSDLSRFWEEIEAGGWGSDHPYLLLLGLDPMGTPRLVERVEEGLAFEHLERLRENVGLSREEIAELVQIKLRTLDWRKRKAGCIRTSPTGSCVLPGSSVGR